jgi:hypothetical protein
LNYNWKWIHFLESIETLFNAAGSTSGPQELFDQPGAPEMGQLETIS